MSTDARPYGAAPMLGRASSSPSLDMPPPGPSSRPKIGTPELVRSLCEVKGQAQFLLYLADQIEDSLKQLHDEAEPGHAAFLCKVLSMYSAQMESKHVGLGDRIAETCQEVYVAVREFDAS